MGRIDPRRKGRNEVWLDNLVRRFTIRATLKGVARLLGYKDDEGNQEEDEADVFPGVGFWARPVDGRGEAIRLLLAHGHSVVVATRDERTRTALEAHVQLAPGETAIFSGAAVVVCRKDGTIEARSWAGTAVPLATLADLQELRDWIAARFDPLSGHTHSASGSGPPAPPPPPNPTNLVPPHPTGTTKLRGE